MNLNTQTLVQFHDQDEVENYSKKKSFHIQIKFQMNDFQDMELEISNLLDEAYKMTEKGKKESNKNEEEKNKDNELSKESTSIADQKTKPDQLSQIESSELRPPIKLDEKKALIQTENEIKDQFKKKQKSDDTNSTTETKGELDLENLDLEWSSSVPAPSKKK